MLRADPADIEKAIKVPPPSLLSIHPLRPLYDACRYLIRTHARRLPLIDKDSQTQAEVVISVLTQYRVLKFIATNVSHDCSTKLTGSVEISHSTSLVVYKIEELGPMSTPSIPLLMEIDSIHSQQLHLIRRYLTSFTCFQNVESVPFLLSTLPAA